MQISLAAQAGNRLRTSFFTPYVCNYPYCLVSSFMSWTPSQCRPAPRITSTRSWVHMQHMLNGINLSQRCPQLVKYFCGIDRLTL
jgi:hypothetical protein